MTSVKRADDLQRKILHRGALFTVQSVPVYSRAGDERQSPVVVAIARPHQPKVICDNQYPVDWQEEWLVLHLTYASQTRIQ